MDGRKRLSGAEYRKLAKEKRKKGSDALSQTPKLEVFFKKPNVNEDEGLKEKSDSTECYLPKRYILCLLAFFGLFNVYAMRVNLSVAMVAMVNQTTPLSHNDSRFITECANLMPKKNISETTTFKGEQFNWNAEVQGLILSAFFYGYILTQIPGGFLAEKYGAKWFFGLGVFITAIFSLLTPAAAHWGVWPFLVVRFLEGLGEGVTFPSANIIISRWSPKLERTRLSTFIFTGAQIGNVIAMPTSGLLSSSEALGGWPSAFYVFGSISCVWFLFWAFLMYETPAEHPFISSTELQRFQDNGNNHTSPKKRKTPWKDIFTSVPMWAVLVAHFGHNFGFLVLLTELPSYLNTILHFNIRKNGILSALPYIVQALAAWTSSYFADKLRRSGVFSITTIRKIFNSIGLIGPAICLVAVTMSGCRPFLIVGLISTAMALNGFVYAGYSVTHVDMSPNFAGTLYGITNAVANLSGIIGPAIVGRFTEHGATRANWASVFYITSVIYAISAAFFIYFASAEPQQWGEEHRKSKKDFVSDSSAETSS